MTLSQRGRRLVESPPAAEYLQAHFARSAAPFDPELRPDGYVPLCVAENKLVTDLLAPKLGAARDVPARVLGYDAMIGSLDFRERLAAFMGQRFLGRSVRAEQLAVLSGAGSVLELLFHVIADPGDGVLVPTPSYAGFWPDLETRDELRVVPVHTQSSEGFRLTPERLDAACAAAGRPVRALLFTSPDNPMGRVYDASELEAVLVWAERAGVHLVVDEIYALSVFGARPFVSAASLRPALGQRLHIVWAFSKDFAASGLRTGVMVSENAEVLRAVDGLAYWACSSGLTQLALGELISDRAWLETYLTTMRARLGEAYRRVAGALDEQGIEHLPSGAGFFLLVDLRRFLAAPTWDAEAALWRRLLDTANVNLTPGAACRVGEPGFMRLCFAGVPTDAAVHAVQRIGQVLRA
ncbi:MAG: aminotransferase class I/II-fold pyridoxal phosphate-dependent enzyme [Polyangiaceae bacterium]|nr:aminotransferase class I/II-fold pyridoxal phosphate-dependent enzyme [Polyangiaceae bacterium]MCE7890363.1 aminotransferase class I/II-fold pyridoxal phosphate-dependent enzyme [Sorangiineae bacterium PRO1]